MLCCFLFFAALSSVIGLSDAVSLVIALSACLVCGAVGGYRFLFKNSAIYSKNV